MLKKLFHLSIPSHESLKNRQTDRGRPVCDPQFFVTKNRSHLSIKSIKSHK
ncbi:MAG: hypothetical protein LBP59_07520 [Planctomycetaceae bacterium]|nr:hypothetical protein [Planctomycetaceae bacterium]